ncbi:MAG: hypothetical protein M5R40_23145 [Anaerolineae bacterium]|nr:hypothetical protein [Anaerolineae bacterium]
MAALAQMRADLLNPDVRRSHNQPFRCARCGYREICDQSLAQVSAGPGVQDNWDM